MTRRPSLAESAQASTIRTAASPSSAVMGGGGYVAGSYPERAGDAVFHTVALADPNGAIVAPARNR